MAYALIIFAEKSQQCDRTETITVYICSRSVNATSTTSCATKSSEKLFSMLSLKIQSTKAFSIPVMLANVSVLCCVDEWLFVAQWFSG